MITAVIEKSIMAIIKKDFALGSITSNVTEDVANAPGYAISYPSAYFPTGRPSVKNSFEYDFSPSTKNVSLSS